MKKMKAWKKGVSLGGIWGLVNGVISVWALFGGGFAEGHTAMDYFPLKNPIGVIIFFPAFITIVILENFNSLLIFPLGFFIPLLLSILLGYWVTKIHWKAT
ncbi:MAG: hypothetical protein QME59_01330 [Candidatus Hydrothermarchaeota archaeon]|nr:hypothetical protein [Candidatus Hydrothermarchaeota archaeon]